jgi:hypothetical protein
MRCVRTLSNVTSGRPLAVTKGSFFASAHLQLSVALVHSQGCVYRPYALFLAKASGQQVVPGADTTPVLDCQFSCPYGACLLAVTYSLRLA